LAVTEVDAERRRVLEVSVADLRKSL